MTIQEAIQSGKRFRREAFANKAWWSASPGYLEICVGDLMANDWEVEEQKITVTKDEVIKAFDSVIFNCEFVRVAYAKEYMLKNLGFK